MNVLCILTDGFEELEAVGTIALLRRAGISVNVASLDKESATGRFDIALTNLTRLEEINVSEYDGLFLPGGPHYQKIEASALVMNILATFIKEKKIVAAICAAPTILGRQGYLKNKQYTCYTSMNEDFGGNYCDQYVVCDDNMITGRSAAATIDFAFALIEKLLGKDKALEVKASIYY
ncbi:MAG: DJ-1/PfpI family protein [Longicatena sp.]